jgi:hypothetical protein
MAALKTTNHNNSYLWRSLALLGSLLVLLNVTSCGCDNFPKQNSALSRESIPPQSGSLSMDVAPLHLRDKQKTTVATFKLTEGNQTADLNSYQVKIKLQGEKGSKGSAIRYQDINNVSKTITDWVC